MLSVTRRLTTLPETPVQIQLALTADERTRSRHWFETDDGQAVYLQLPRGTLLQHGDVLADEAGHTLIQVIAKPEPVMTVRAGTPLQLLRAAYHLGNRHVALEVTESHLRFAPDPVLQDLVQRLGLTLVEEVAPFQPEAGAYGDRHPLHSHSHAPSSHGHAHPAPPQPSEPLASEPLYNEAL